MHANTNGFGMRKVQQHFSVFFLKNQFMCAVLWAPPEVRECWGVFIKIHFAVIIHVYTHIFYSMVCAGKMHGEHFATLHRSLNIGI